MFRSISYVVMVSVLSLSPSIADEPNWVTTSNQYADTALHNLVQFAPEIALQLGVEGFDEEIVDLRLNLYQRTQKASRQTAAKLEKALEDESDSRVRQDLNIMIQSTKRGIETARLQQEYMLPYFNIGRTMFSGIKGLLDDQVPKEQYLKAIIRLRKYVGLEGVEKPLTELAKDRMSERFSENLLGPYKGQLEQDISNSQQFLSGIKQLFEKRDLDGWQESYALLEKQFESYVSWLNAEMLPRARTNHRLPEAIYADNLKNFGVDISPQELMSKATTAFAEIRNEMKAIAPLVAKQHGFDYVDYQGVIKNLKKDQLIGDSILEYYKQVLSQLETIIRDENIITLPDRDAVIRLATEAETAAVPAPHMQPPRLIGNTGQYGQFVLPLSLPPEKGEKSGKAFDDFTFKASAWTLTVHEARPGHELQFTSLVEKGISTARVIFAFNSVNAEGWGLYTEAEMKPYMPLDGQLISLQHRLMRATRAFIDPMLNMGLMTAEDAKAFIMEHVVLSDAMATQEVERYTFRSPGQATSYFYGYSRIMELRAKAEIALGDQFNRKDFHDFLLAQGLLPPDLMEQAVMEQFVTL